MKKIKEDSKEYIIRDSNLQKKELKMVKLK
jgi:hypothetical protein